MLEVNLRTIILKKRLIIEKVEKFTINDFRNDLTINNLKEEYVNNNIKS